MTQIEVTKIWAHPGEPDQVHYMAVNHTTGRQRHLVERRQTGWGKVLVEEMNRRSAVLDAERAEASV